MEGKQVWERATFRDIQLDARVWRGQEGITTPSVTKEQKSAEKQLSSQR